MPVSTKGRARQTPQRTCIVCRTTGAKRQLYRIVRTPAGEVKFDPTSKVAGRGAYLCEKRECWRKALDRGLLARSLKTTIAVETYAALLAEAERLTAPLTTEPPVA